MSTLQCPQCSTTLDSSSEIPLRFCSNCRFPLQPIANKYVLEQRLAEGGFGMLYLARHTALDKRAQRVVKVFKSDLFQSEELHQRFLREVRVTAALSEENPHIVRIYDDFGEEPDLGLYYVMEYLRGETLEEQLERETVFAPEKALHIFYQLCRAMRAAHREGIVHRDLKPSNIFLIQREETDLFVKVIDFGIAKLTEGTQNGLTQGVLGTPHYMSPEQCQGHPIDARTDLYAMAIILYEMLCGKTPFGHRSTENILPILHAHVSEPIPPMKLGKQTESLPTGIEDVIRTALAKQPDARFATVDAFWNALVDLDSTPDSLQYLGRHVSSSLDGLSSLEDATHAPHTQGLSGADAQHVASTIQPEQASVQQPKHSSLKAESSRPTPLDSPNTSTASSKTLGIGLLMLLLGGVGLFFWSRMGLPTALPPSTQTHKRKARPIRRISVKTRPTVRSVVRVPHPRLRTKPSSATSDGRRSVHPPPRTPISTAEKRQIRRLYRTIREAKRQRYWMRSRRQVKSVLIWYIQLCQIHSKHKSTDPTFIRMRRDFVRLWNRYARRLPRTIYRNLLPDVASLQYAYAYRRYRSFLRWMDAFDTHHPTRRGLKRAYRTRQALSKVMGTIQRMGIRPWSMCAWSRDAHLFQSYAGFLGQIAVGQGCRTCPQPRRLSREVRILKQKARRSYRRLLRRATRLRHSGQCIAFARQQMQKL